MVRFFVCLSLFLSSLVCFALVGVAVYIGLTSGWNKVADQFSALAIIWFFLTLITAGFAYVFGEVSSW